MIDLEKARKEAAEIQARHRDITQLEKALAELRDMFADLALLISNQVPTLPFQYPFHSLFRVI